MPPKLANSKLLALALVLSALVYYAVHQSGTGKAANIEPTPPPAPVITDSPVHEIHSLSDGLDADDETDFPGTPFPGAISNGAIQ